MDTSPLLDLGQHRSTGCSGGPRQDSSRVCGDGAHVLSLACHAVVSLEHAISVPQLKLAMVELELVHAHTDGRHLRRVELLAGERLDRGALSRAARAAHHHTRVQKLHATARSGELRERLAHLENVGRHLEEEKSLLAQSLRRLMRARGRGRVLGSGEGQRGRGSGVGFGFGLERKPRAERHDKLTGN